MADVHNRTRYLAGCRCDACRKANSDYSKQRRRQKAQGGESTASVTPLRSTRQTRTAPPPPAARELGDTEAAVMEEIGGLSTVKTRPGLVAVALAHARVLDDPLALSQHASNGRQLMEVLDKLRKGSDARGGRLASVQRMTGTRSATG